MPLSFPAKQLEDYYRKRIAEIPSFSISDSTLPLIRFCHWRSDNESADNKFELWGGFSEADSEIKRCLVNKEQPPPVLIFGLLSLEQVKELSDKTKPLEWTGVQYLCYDVSDEDLQDAVEQVIEGAQKPVPESLWVTQEDLDSKNKELHHYLDGRRKSINGHKQNFEDAQHGKKDLDEAYYRKPIIKPIRLRWQKEIDCRRSFKEHLASEVMLDDKLAEAIEAFECCVDQIETIRREKLLNNESTLDQGNKQSFAAIVKAIEKAYIELEKAIKALEEEIPC